MPSPILKYIQGQRLNSRQMRRLQRKHEKKKDEEEEEDD